MNPYPDDIKQAILSEYAQGLTVASLCLKYEASKSSIYNWIHEYSEIKTKSEKTVTPRQIYLLKKRYPGVKLKIRF